MAIQQIKLGGKSIVPDVFSALSTASGSTTAPSSVADIRNSTSPILNINGSGHLYHLYVPHTAMLNIEIDGKLAVKGYTGSEGSDIINVHSFYYKPVYDGSNLCAYVPIEDYTSESSFKKIVMDSNSKILNNYAKGYATGSLSSTVIAFDELFYENNIKIYVYSYNGTSTYVVNGTICKEV